jgi:hypothetical protein
MISMFLLDTGSTSSFCTRELADGLNIRGKEATLQISTIDSSSKQKMTEVLSLQVSTSNGEILHMPNVYVTESIPVPSVKWEVRYKHLVDIPVPKSDCIKVDILIGQDCSEALVPLEVRKGSIGEPYAVRTMLGWSISGPLHKGNNMEIVSHLIKLDKQVEKMWSIENELLSDDKGMSKEDQAVINYWEQKGKLSEVHYELPIPWIRKVGDRREPKLQNNKVQAINRLNMLQKRLNKDYALKEKYEEGIQVL